MRPDCLLSGFSRMTNPATEGPLIYLVAVDPSADDLGAQLMAALSAETGGRVRFAGYVPLRTIRQT